MGLLSKGTPPKWEETKKNSEKAKLKAAKQFIRHYKKYKDRKGYDFLWGDEVEYVLIKFDNENKTAKVLLKAESLLEELKYTTDRSDCMLWNIEYTSFNIEGIPKIPYTGDGDGFVAMETNLKKRKETVNQKLGQDEEIITISNFPRIGCQNVTTPEQKEESKTSGIQSLFFPDELLFKDHPKMLLMSTNIHDRRGENSVINIPVFKDEKTPSPFQEDLSMFGAEGCAALPALTDHIYMDCSALGLVCTSLQVTMQCSDLEEAKYLYDQLVPLCPIMIALAAAAPIYKGYLSDYDGRWDVISQGADERTKQEQLYNENSYKQIRRRWESVECYLSESNKKYNLDNLYYNEDIYKMLVESEVDESMAKHIAYLLIREPMYMYREDMEKLDQEDLDSTEIFDHFNSSNWLSLKLKLPLLEDDKTGWRVEFRPMDAQLTDKESAACSVFVVLLSRAILKYKLDFVVPISVVDKNMKRSYKRNAVNQGRFYFRENIYTENSPAGFKTINGHGDICQSNQDGYREMTINDIINGIQGQRPGLISILSKYLDEMTLEEQTRKTIQGYLSIISARASGEMKTGAKWIRDFVSGHPSYKKDSVVSEEINYDLLKKISELSKSDSIDMLFSNFT